MVRLKLLLSLFFIFVLLNLYFSQTISPIYLYLISDNKNAAVEFLKKIKPLPDFNYEIIKYKKIYGARIENEVFKDDWQKKQTINKLEQLLRFNPKSRDVLFGLYLLYSRTGEKNRAQEYLSRAKAVDPVIK